jgi:hypothetical protein
VVVGEEAGGDGLAWLIVGKDNCIPRADPEEQQQHSAQLQSDIEHAVQQSGAWSKAASSRVVKSTRTPSNF